MWKNFIYQLRPILTIGVEKIGHFLRAQYRLIVYIQGATSGSTDVVAGMSESGGVRSEGGNASRRSKVYHTEHEAIILQSRTTGYIHALTLQRRIGIKSPRFVNHTGYEVESKGRVDVITTTLAKAAEPAQGAKEVFQNGSDFLV